MTIHSPAGGSLPSGAASSSPSEELVATLHRQLLVAQTEVQLHLAEVHRLRFITSEITKAAEGGIFVREDLAGNYMYISEELAEILGYGDCGLPYSYKHFLEQVHPDDLPSCDAGCRDAKFCVSTAPSNLEDALPGPVPPNIFPTAPGEHLEFRYLNQRGEYRWFRASAKHYRTTEAGPEQIIGLIIDIDAVKQLEAQRQAVNEELKAFMYSVAHDLRAPVRHIASFTEILREDADVTSPEERLTYLEYVEQSAVRLGKMIDGLLQLSRNQRVVPKKVPVDMDALLDKLIEGTRKTERRATDLVIERDPLPHIETDPTLIEQVVQNLLSNAIKYSSNRARAQVRIRYYLQEAQHVIAFSDNGIGFDPRYADKLFRLFSRLYVEEDIPGTGVGLASVHRILRSLGGSIEADGKLGVGATFTIRLPVNIVAHSAF